MLVQACSCALVMLNLHGQKQLVVNQSVFGHFKSTTRQVDAAFFCGNDGRKNHIQTEINTSGEVRRESAQDG